MTIGTGARVGPSEVKSFTVPVSGAGAESVAEDAAATLSSALLVEIQASISDCVFPAAKASSAVAYGAEIPEPIESVGELARVHGEKLPLWEMIYGLTLIGETSWARVYLRSLTEENRAYYRSSGARRRKWAFAPRFYLDNRDDSEYGIWGEQSADKAPRSKVWAQGIATDRPTVLRKKLLKVYRALGEHYYARRVSYYDGPKLTYPEVESEDFQAF